MYLCGAVREHQQRVANREDGPDRIEREGDGFMAACADGFDHLAEMYNWIIVDASGDVGAVHAKVVAAVRLRLEAGTAGA